MRPGLKPMKPLVGNVAEMALQKKEVLGEIGADE